MNEGTHEKGSSLPRCYGMKKGALAGYREQNVATADNGPPHVGPLAHSFRDVLATT